MYVIKCTFRRADDSVPFYEDQKFNLYQEKMYRKKLAHEHRVLDGQIMRHIQVWPTEEAYRLWADDPTVMKYNESRDVYNSEHDIVMNEVTAVV